MIISLFKPEIQHVECRWSGHFLQTAIYIGKIAFKYLWNFTSKAGQWQSNTSPDHHQAPTNFPIPKIFLKMLLTQNEAQRLPTGFPRQPHIYHPRGATPYNMYTSSLYSRPRQAGGQCPSPPLQLGISAEVSAPAGYICWGVPSSWAIWLVGGLLVGTVGTGKLELI
jgi:hypothetical protein